MILGIEAAHAQKPNRTGVEEYCLQIILHLKKVIPSNVRVILYVKDDYVRTTNHTKVRTDDDCAKVNGEPTPPVSPPLRGDLFGELPGNWEIRVLKWPLGRLWSQFRLSWEFLWHKPDIFFAPGQLVPFFCPANTIAMIHDSAFLVFPKVYSFIGRIYLTWMNKRIIKRAKIILTSTNFNKSELVRLYGEKVVDRIGVIPLAYDDTRFRYDGGFLDSVPMRIGTSLGMTFSKNAPYIIFVGRLEEKKNIGGVVKAFNLLKSSAKTEKEKNLKLVLVGKPGVGYSEIEEEIESSPYKNDIVQLGYVGSSDLPTLVAGAEAFVFPSLYEGFGIPVLEAMAVGTPVITSNLPALKEVGGEAAMYADLLDADDLAHKISELINNPLIKEQLRQKGLKRAGLFSWGKTAQKTWEAIAKLL